MWSKRLRAISFIISVQPDLNSNNLTAALRNKPNMNFESRLQSSIAETETSATTHLEFLSLLSSHSFSLVFSAVKRDANKKCGRLGNKWVMKNECV